MCIYCSQTLVYPSPNCYANAMAIGARRKVDLCLDCCPTTSPLPVELRSKAHGS